MTWIFWLMLPFACFGLLAIAWLIAALVARNRAVFEEPDEAEIRLAYEKGFQAGSRTGLGRSKL